MEWDLLDLAGPIESFDVHWASESLVYSSGPVVIIWDIHADKKVNLRCHDASVTALFFTPDQSYLFTIESSLQPTVCVWRWSTLEQIHATLLPQKMRVKPVEKIHTCFCPKTNRLVIVANESDGGYQCSLWVWQAPELTQHSVIEMDHREKCLGVHFLSDAVTLLTVEP